jgi:hypothetical protein
MSECVHEDCTNTVEYGKDECYRHRLLSVGVTWRGGARLGKSSWNVSRGDWMRENLGTTDDRVVGRQGIERAQ